jgi:hypothetical protein
MTMTGDQMVAALGVATVFGGLALHLVGLVGAAAAMRFTVLGAAIAALGFAVGRHWIPATGIGVALVAAFALIPNLRSFAMPTFFTTPGAWAFVASQVIKALTAYIFLTFIWDQGRLWEFGVIRGTEQSSPLLTSAIAGIIAAALAVLGSVACPTGKGTRKWWSNDLFYTLLLGFVLAIGLGGWAFFTSATVKLTGLKLDLALLVLVLFVVQLFASLIADHIQDVMAPTLTPPAVPAPTFVRFAANPTAANAGGTVSLEWATANAVRAEITGFGQVSLAGPMPWVLRGAAGTTETVTMVLTNSAGVTATQAVNITINP